MHTAKVFFNSSKTEQICEPPFPTLDLVSIDNMLNSHGFFHRVKLASFPTPTPPPFPPPSD